MVSVHGMQVEPIAAREVNNQNIVVDCQNLVSSSVSTNGISLPPNVTSTGTQVQLVKKPGRKRKSVNDKGANDNVVIMKS
ncbi:MAG: hypothetical protein MUF38_14955, partial [Anaerolineae bacterium]|nr:hypothetical protein [Anaerolineae bacterium]